MFIRGGLFILFLIRGSELHPVQLRVQAALALESGEKTAAELVGKDALSDLAVLTIDAKHADAVLELVIPISCAQEMKSWQSATRSVSISPAQ